MIEKDKIFLKILMLLLFCFSNTLIAQISQEEIIDHKTHWAIDNGNWNDPNTWANGAIPEEGAIVYISHDFTVTYNHSSTDHIFIILVDGTFICREDTVNETTNLKFDTFLSGMMSNVQFLGNSDTDGEIVVDIEAYDLSNQPSYWSLEAKNHFTDNLPVKDMEIIGSGTARYQTYEDAINSSNPLTITRTQLGVLPNGKGVLGRYNWDPTQVSIGIMTMGNVTIQGREKLNMTKLDESAIINSNTITVQDTTGWEVGDDLIITRDGELGGVNFNYEDQKKIANISGNIITLTEGLDYNHRVEKNKAFEGLFPYVGNLTRNITFQSPETALIDERGHFMAMNGTRDINIKNASFVRMGRTDKSRPADDFYFANWIESPNFKTLYSAIGKEVAEMASSPIDEVINPRGRYSIHLHKLGAEYGAKMAQVTGNVVWDNPGWGITHHDSHANISENVVYNVIGAGIVSESGSETGTWDNNLVVNVQEKVADDIATSDVLNTYQRSLYFDDVLFKGIGLAMKGRAVLCRNNVIANAQNAVKIFNPNASITNLDRVDPAALATTRGTEYEVDQFPLSRNGYSKEGDGVAPAEAALIMENTSAIWCGIGFNSIERDLNVNHESRSIFKGYIAWGVSSGLEVNYQADYTFEDVYISGNNGSNNKGITFWKHAHNHVFKNVILENLEYGLEPSKVVVRDDVLPKHRNDGVSPWIFIDLQTISVGTFYKFGQDLESSLASLPNFEYPYENTFDNIIYLNSSGITSRPTTFTTIHNENNGIVLNKLDYNETDPEEQFKFRVDGVITDDLGSYNFGIEQALGHNDLRPDYPERIYQFASKEKFEEYLQENGIYKNEETDEVYFIIEEKVPNRITYQYETIPVRIVIENAPTTGTFANPTTESTSALAPQSQLISRSATVSQSSDKTGLTFGDGYNGTESPVYGERAIDASAYKAIDGNNNGRINARYYEKLHPDAPLGSFSETEEENESWFDLDFGEIKRIEYIDIWNTVELNGTNKELPSDHFENFYVLIADTPFTGMTLTQARQHASHEEYKDVGATLKFSVNNLNIHGRYMRIQVEDVNKIKLAEVEVIGKSIPDLQAICKDITVQLDENGSVTIDPQDVNDGSIGAINLDVSPNVFTCDDITETNTVTLTVGDGFGNIDQCTAVVTVVDEIPPTILCPENLVVETGANGNYLLPDYFASEVVTATDNCTSTSLQISQIPSPGSILNVGIHTVALFVTDDNGNTSDCNLELSVDQNLLINDIGGLQLLRMYPNPTKKSFFISNPQDIKLKRAKIYDTLGRLVKNINIENIGKEKEIDLSELRTATYLINIESEQAEIFKVLVVE